MAGFCVTCYGEVTLRAFAVTAHPAKRTTTFVFDDAAAFGAGAALGGPLFQFKIQTGGGHVGLNRLGHGVGA